MKRKIDKKMLEQFKNDIRELVSGIRKLNLSQRILLKDIVKCHIKDMKKKNK